jgi:sulfate/thiosulfate transport system permease protein
VVREVVPTLREIGTEQEQAAQTLGASGWQTFRRVTLPAIRWAVIYGVVLTAARGIGEFGAVAVVSGNFAGQTQTATLRVEDAYQFAYGEYAPAYGIAFVLAATAVIILIAMIFLQPKESRY